MRTFFSVIAAALALSLVFGVAMASAPSAPTYTAPGTYTVSWGVSNPYGSGPVILEKQGIHGEYQLLDDPDADGVVQVTRPEGEYVYIGIDFYLTSSDGWYYWEPIPSDETLTIVSSGPTPSQALMSTQLQYTYAVRYGDINADGRTDLYLNRTSGGTAGDGAVVKLILTQLANQKFSAIVPNASQVTTASSWPSAAVTVQLEDFNLDGFVDVLLRGVGSLLSGVNDQIVFAPGKLFAGAPQAVTAIGTEVQSFIADFDRWSRNPDYFDQNAPIIQVPVYSYQYWCYAWSYPGYDDYGGYYDYQCFLYPVLVGYTPYRDYSVFDQSVVAMTGAFTTVSSGDLTPQVVPGTAAATLFHDVFRRVFGVDVLRGVLRNGCTGGILAYDADTTINCTDTTTIGQTLLLNLQQFTTERGQCRSVTTGENLMQAGEGLGVNNVSGIRICNRTLWYLFGLDLFGSGYWMTTPSTIWVGGGWTEDYSTPTSGSNFDLASVLVHEFMHSYQYRNQHYSLVGMVFRRLLNSSYVYMPMTPGKTFFQYGIEQQAEMVQDRYRKRCNATASASTSGNSSVTLSALNAIVPFTTGTQVCVP